MITTFPIIYTLDDWDENLLQSRVIENIVDSIHHPVIPENHDNTFNSLWDFSLDNPLSIYLDTILGNNNEVVEEQNSTEDLQKMWSPQETELLLLNMEKYGTQWSKMNINNRTVSSIRNRWIRIKPENDKYIYKRKNKCLKCGLFKRGHICKYQNII